MSGTGRRLPGQPTRCDGRRADSCVLYPRTEKGGEHDRRVRGGSHLCASSYCHRYRHAARQSDVRSTTSPLGFRYVIPAWYRSSGRASPASTPSSSTNSTQGQIERSLVACPIRAQYRAQLRYLMAIRGQLFPLHVRKPPNQGFEGFVFQAGHLYFVIIGARPPYAPCQAEFHELLIGWS
jgi:hypothetical protein